MNEDFPNFRQTLAASAVLHALFFLLARGVPGFNFNPAVEVEITSPFLGTGPARLAPPKAKVTDKGNPLPAQELKPVSSTKPPEPQKDWIAPTTANQKIEKAPENAQAPGAVPNGTESAPSSGGVTGGTGISPMLGGIDGHSPYGTPNGTGDGGSLATAPKLLNKDVFLALMRKYYPENERRAGRDGDVQLKIHIAVDGTVGSSEIVHTDAEDFGVAAQRVALVLRFSPAMRGGQPVPAAVMIPFLFRIHD